MSEPATGLREIRQDLHVLDRPVELTPAAFLDLPPSLKKLLWWIILERAVTIARLARFYASPRTRRVLWRGTSTHAASSSRFPPAASRSTGSASSPAVSGPLRS
ncbi:MAG: hypothetical protein AB9873_04000 [Syntrophobacteraceae bacterium]